MLIKKSDVSSFTPKILKPDIIKSLANDYTEFFNPKICKIDSHPELLPGREFVYNYLGALGALQEKVEGEDMAEGTLGTESISITPTVKALKVNFSLEAGGSYYGDLAGDVRGELTRAFNISKNKNVFNAIKATTTTAMDRSTNLINLADLNVALGTLGKVDNRNLTLFINSTQAATLRASVDSNGNTQWAEAINADVQRSGVIGTIYGMNVVISDLIVSNEDVITNYIVRDQSVAFVYSSGANGIVLDKEENKSKLVTTVFAHGVFESKLFKDAKVLPIEFKSETAL